MATMRAMQVGRPDGPFELVERPIPAPGPGDVRIRVEACGVCHSDSFVKSGHFPGLIFPRIPGHEAVGVVDALGSGVSGWREGTRVGIGWNGGYCGRCENCRRGDFFCCTTQADITGGTRDGGYAEYMLAPATAIARVPDAIGALDAAPLMCAGVTTFNALRNSDARPGDTVAVLGLGGLGHLAVQFAARMGFRTVAIARGRDKRALAMELGAHAYIDSAAGDPGVALRDAGGARVILATAPNAAAMQAVIGGLGPRGTMIVIGAVPTLEVPAFQLIGGNQSVRGWYSGTSIDSQDTMAFSALTGVRSINEIFPLQRAEEAYERMMSGKARFRVVLKVSEH